MLSCPCVHVSGPWHQWTAPGQRARTTVKELTASLFLSYFEKIENQRPETEELVKGICVASQQSLHACLCAGGKELPAVLCLMNQLA